MGRANFIDWLVERWRTGRVFWDMGKAMLWLLSFGVPAWAAAASQWLDQYGPIAWVGCGLLGLICAALIFFLVSLTRDKWISTSVKRRFYESGDRINPLETVFNRVRIRIEDLAPPFTPAIKDKTFIDCDILGPANICVMGGSMTGSGGEKVDGIVGRVGAGSHNSIFFHNCVFRNCRFYQITFIVPEPLYALFVANNAGIPFLTHIPSGQQNLPIVQPAPPNEQPQS